ncbi:MAG TPA: hypothetical protein VEB42_08315 [Chitinophagaceae bacterium]|nr:hypothetical protein [Chitinophagaceae bacterium]
MGYHARLPNNIRLRHNVQTMLYEIGENGILYAFPYELTIPIKEYFRQTYIGDDRTVAEWYQRLSSDDKKKVTRSGNVPEGDAFYPDPTYD